MHVGVFYKGAVNTMQIVVFLERAICFASFCNEVNVCLCIKHPRGTSMTQLCVYGVYVSVFVYASMYVCRYVCMYSRMDGFMVQVQDSAIFYQIFISYQMIALQKL